MGFAHTSSVLFLFINALYAVCKLYSYTRVSTGLLYTNNILFLLIPFSFPTVVLFFTVGLPNMFLHGKSYIIFLKIKHKLLVLQENGYITLYINNSTKPDIELIKTHSFEILSK